MTVYDSNNEVFFYEEIEVETQRQGRIQGYLKVLAKLFGPDKEWYQLITETRQLVDESRDQRNAPERPVYKRKEVYMEEHRQQLEKVGG